MGTKAGGTGGEWLSLLEDCLALQLKRAVSCQHDPTSQYWLYDSGYLLYQGFVEANLKCGWDPGLTAAVRGLQFRGYVSPGILLVGGSGTALHLLRAAWSRRVLKPPPSYLIVLVGDVEDCIVSKVQQTSFTPLSDAVCWVILQLTGSGQPAVLASIRSSLSATFPEIEQPSSHLLYDTLADLMSENKIYQTAGGYFISSGERSGGGGGGGGGRRTGRQMLLSHQEAAVLVSGEIVTIREGAKTHQAIQTNLADVICGGNKSDKVLYGRTSRGGGSGGRKLERRHSMRLLGSSRRLASLHRAGSVRLLHRDPPLSSAGEPSQKKCGLFSKLFKWSKRQSPGGVVAGGGGTPHGIASALSLAFPPPHEWFNSTVLGLHSVGTQTKTLSRAESGTTEWSEREAAVQVSTRRRSLSTSRLPRRAARAAASPPTSPPSPLPLLVEPPPPPLSSPSPPGGPSPSSSSKTLLPPPSTPPHKALSSASSGYNSLPRSHKSKNKKQTDSTTDVCSNPSVRRSTSNSIKVEVSAGPSGVSTDTQVDAQLTIGGDPSGSLTTTINGPNSTKIFVQQHNSPIRSLITFEKSRKSSFNEKIKEDPKNEKRVRRPSSFYQQKERDTTKESRNNVQVKQLSNNIKMKFPSTETIIQMEEKHLISANMNNKKEFLKKNLDILKTGSLIDVAECTEEGGRLNNVRKASASLTPLQPALSSDKVLESLSYKNVLKESLFEPLTKNDDKNNRYSSNNKLQLLDKTSEVSGKKVEPRQRICSFPSLSDLSLHFTSIAAQNILNGVSINSLDTLVEANEKNSLKDMSIHTDMGIV